MKSLIFSLLVLILLINQVHLQQLVTYTSNVVGGYKGDFPQPYLNFIATQTVLPYITGLHVLKSPNGEHDDVYFSDHNSIYKIDTSDGLLTLVGSNVSNRIHRIHVAPAIDSVFWFDDSEYVIKKLNYKTKLVTTIAGIPGIVDTTPDQLATNTSLGYYVDSLFYTKKGELYFANAFNSKVKKVTLNGYIETIVGNSYIPTDNDELNAAFNLPQNATGILSNLVLVTSLWVTEGKYGELVYLGNSGQIHLVNMSSGVKTIIAGSQNQASSFSVKDGITARGNSISGGLESIVVENNGLDSFEKVYYFTDRNNGAIRKVVNGKVYAHVSGGTYGFSTLANKTYASAEILSISPTTNEVYYADTGKSLIRKVSKKGVVTTVGGSLIDETLPPLRSKISPLDLCLNSKNDLIFLDKNSNKITKLVNGTNQFITLINGYDSPQVGEIYSLYVDADDSIYFSSTSQIFKLLENGTRIVIAGNGKCVMRDVDAESDVMTTPICYIYAMLRIKDGSMLIALGNDDRIKRITADGKINTFIGNISIPSEIDLGNYKYLPYFTNDGLKARETSIRIPIHIGQLSTGEIVYIEYETPRVRKLQKDGTIITILGNGTIGYNGDQGEGRSILLNAPLALFVTKDDSILVADSRNNRILKLNSKTGLVSTLLDSKSHGINTPTSVRANEKGEVYVSDYGNSQIRKFTPSCPSGYNISPNLDSCELTSCFGKSPQDPTVCSSHGSCIALDTCKCNSQFSGKDCSEPVVTELSTRLNHSNIQYASWLLFTFIIVFFSTF